MQRTLYSSQLLLELEFSQQIFEKSSNIKFHGEPNSGSRIIPCGQTDGQKDARYEGYSVFSQFCKRA
jgi:hypothetical protein